jgi:hypothetical protein
VVARRLASWLEWRRLGLGRPGLLLRRLWLWLPALGSDSMGAAPSLDVLIGPPRGYTNKAPEQTIRGLAPLSEFVFYLISDRTCSRHWRSYTIARREHLLHMTGLRRRIGIAAPEHLMTSHQQEYAQCDLSSG